MRSPQSRRSPARIDILLDPDFREIGASGRMWTRPPMMSALNEEGSDDDEQFSTAELEAAIVGPAPLLVTLVSDRGQR